MKSMGYGLLVLGMLALPLVPIVGGIAGVSGLLLLVVPITRSGITGLDADHRHGAGEQRPSPHASQQRGGM